MNINVFYISMQEYRYAFMRFINIA